MQSELIDIGLLFWQENTDFDKPDFLGIFLIYLKNLAYSRTTICSIDNKFVKFVIPCISNNF